jgi:adenosylcobyric acid synthase
MGFARAAGVPVVLVGDIDRGGVIAAIVGTRAVIDPADAAMIRGFIINKFRGDPALFEDGYAQIERLSGWRGFGVVPWLAATARLPSEDAVILDRRADRREGRVVVACPILPRISNFDDLDPLKLETDVELVMVPPGRPIPAEAALIVLPGSKATIADLAALRAEGWDVDILAHHRRGGMILGLCGGYQMLGRRVGDPDGIEGPPADVEGLGLLDVATVLSPVKALKHVEGRALGATFEGYEMHMGETSGGDAARPFGRFGDGHADGAINARGNVMGTYVHGILADAGLRAALLARLGVVGGGQDYDASVDGALDEIAVRLEEHLDIDALLSVARENMGAAA